MMKSLTIFLVFGILVLGIASHSLAQSKAEQEEKVATAQQIELQIEGMVCGMCEQNCKKSLEKLEGVKVDSISASKGVAKIIYSGSEPIRDKTLKEAVENAGYKLKKVQRKNNSGSGNETDQ